MFRKWIEKGKLSPGEQTPTRRYDTPLRQILAEVVLGDYRADTTPSGTVDPVPFTTSASLRQINEVFEAGATKPPEDGQKAA